jgi:hypothetical protein
MNFATPSSRFKRDAIQQPAPMNFYAPPKGVEYSNSGVMNDSADAQGVIPTPAPQQQYFKPAPAATRPGAVPTPGAESYALPVMQGLQNSQVPATTDLGTQAVAIGANTLAGAAGGALTGASIGAAGGPIGAAGGAAIGAGVALVSSGLNAWMNNKQARAERDRLSALKADAERIRNEDLARNQKWMVQNRLDSLAAAAEDRRRFNANQARQDMQNTAVRLQAALANNASLRDHWAKYGFN